MTAQEQLPHALTIAYGELLSALDGGLVQYRANLRWSNQDAVCRAIERFVGGLAELPGGRDELERRATLVEQRTSEGTAYYSTRATALAAYPPPNVGQNWLAIHRLHNSDGAPLYLDQIDQQRRLIERASEDQSLDEQVQEAFGRWRNACRDIQRAADTQAVDGCWWLLRVHDAGEDAPPERAVAARTMLKSTVGGVCLATIRIAVESLMVWARESRTAICPTCGKAAIIDEHDSLRCPDCGNRVGTLSELLIHLQTDSWPAGAETETLATLRHLVRTRWGEWSLDAVKQLRDWLIAEQGLSREQSLVIQQQRVVELLRKDSTAEPTAERASEGQGKATAQAPESERPVIRPSDKALQAWRLRDLCGINKQTELANELTKNGSPATQGQVSRWLKEVEAYLKAGNVLPSIEPLAAAPRAIDPRIIEMGERQDGRTPRQREHRDPASDDW